MSQSGEPKEDSLGYEIMTAIVGDDPISYTELGKRKAKKLKAAIEAHTQRKVIEAYERGRIDEAKVCEKARRHDCQRKVLEELERLIDKTDDEWPDKFNWYVRWGEVKDRIAELKAPNHRKVNHEPPTS